jgi:hypothetical protein
MGFFNNTYNNNTQKKYFLKQDFWKERFGFIGNEEGYKVHIDPLYIKPLIRENHFLEDHHY